jgi:dephospho-CoA kinase
MIERCIDVVFAKIDSRLAAIEVKVDLVSAATKLLFDKVVLVESRQSEQHERLAKLEELTGSFSKKAIRKAAKHAPSRKR